MDPSTQKPIDCYPLQRVHEILCPKSLPAYICRPRNYCPRFTGYLFKERRFKIDNESCLTKLGVLLLNPRIIDRLVSALLPREKVFVVHRAHHTDLNNHLHYLFTAGLV